MPVEKSAGAIIFKKEEGKNFYLLLHYAGVSHRADKDYWDLPKGHIEEGENLEQTARREIKEETGLENIEILPGFKETIKYFFKWENKNILKFVTFFLAKVQSGQVKISGEHIGFEWLDYESALEKLAFKNAKNILRKAHDFLLSEGL